MDSRDGSPTSASQSANGKSIPGLMIWIPALLTNTSMRPSSRPRPASSTCIRIGGGSQLRDLGRHIAALYEVGITLDHLESGILPLAPEADVELVLADAEVV